ncbi:MAG: DUF1788 domain-containing protein [Chloroflexi bacterium]|nr:DUF1788 domain-containing protein [Chloroflexota bacterium]MDA8187560.1 DUF1788 domain-containing protein [Dehalococcoidales bacterium]
MGWTESVQALEQKVEGMLRGTYRPQDGIPFFRVQYPPAQEREALAKLHLFADRLSQRGWPTEIVSLTEILEKALCDLLGVPPSGLSARLQEWEQSLDRPELLDMLKDSLPDAVVGVLVDRLKEVPKESVVVLVRLGALVPFVRSSTFESKLESKVQCVIVLPYPGTTLGAVLDVAAASAQGGYYRGETIPWQ